MTQRQVWACFIIAQWVNAEDSLEATARRVLYQARVSLPNVCLQTRHSRCALQLRRVET